MKPQLKVFKTNKYECVLEWMHGDADGKSESVYYFENTDDAIRAHKFVSPFYYYAKNRVKTPRKSEDFMEKCNAVGIEWERDMTDTYYDGILAKLVGIKWYYYDENGVKYTVEWVNEKKTKSGNPKGTRN